ncbi:MAG: hypothetical protein JWQ38_1170 [Flavipsychrobacter sp.]|nr:hypothetical protein [Flavipsychrobacter sp.]
MFLFCVFGALLLHCTTVHKKDEYYIQENLPEANKKALIAKLDKGMLIYKENCSGCHGIFAKGVKGVPNFSKKQIDKYSAGFVMQDPKNHAVARKIDPERLGLVIQYLRYRVIKGVPSNPDPMGR